MLYAGRAAPGRPRGAAWLDPRRPDRAARAGPRGRGRRPADRGRPRSRSLVAATSSRRHRRAPAADHPADRVPAARGRCWPRWSGGCSARRCARSRRCAPGAEEITGGARPRPAAGARRRATRSTGSPSRSTACCDRLDAARARQRAFVADAAHELRSPLTNMRTELEVAQRPAGHHDWPALAADLLTDVERLPAGRRPAAAGPRRRAPRRVPAGARAGRSATSCCADVARATGRDPADRAVPRVSPRGDARTRWAGWWRTCWTTPCGTPDEGRASARATAPTGVLDGDRRRAGHPGADRERVFDRFTRLDAARAATRAAPGWAWPSSGRLSGHTGAGCIWRTPHRGCVRLCGCLWRGEEGVRAGVRAGSCGGSCGFVRGFVRG